jgi:hypothetical protein
LRHYKKLNQSKKEKTKMTKKNLFVATTVLALSLSTASLAGDQPAGGYTGNPCNSPTPPPECSNGNGGGGGLAQVENTRNVSAKYDLSYVEELISSTLRFLGLAK